MNEMQRKKCKEYINRLKRCFKFMNEMTAGQARLVFECLDHMGCTMKGPKNHTFGNRDVTKKSLTVRYMLAPAVYKLICLGLNDERAYMTKSVKREVKCEFVCQRIILVVESR